MPDNSKWEDMIRELISISDVRGAAIVGMDGSIICCNSSNGTDMNQYIDLVTTKFLRKIPDYNQGMFNESIVDYNGHKILLTGLKPGMILLLVVEKKAYLGLTMLDVECCLRNMDNSQSDHYAFSHKTLG
jgi:predicted regulator of Ras-like GTPase activity (Roadblock/LC7/MglB family)